MSSRTENVVDTLDNMLSEIGAAAEKQAAEANTEAGGYQGETTHPVKNVDDRTDDAQEGARSSENEQDVKEDQGAPSVENTTPGTPGGQDSVTLNIGTTAKATGEDSSVETESAKGGKDDPGTQRGETTHPARTDNDALDGHKYAELIAKADQLDKVGRDLVAAIAVSADGEVQKRAQELAETAEEKAGEEKAGEEKAGDNTDDPPPDDKPPEKAAEDAPPQGQVDQDAVAKQAQTVEVIAHTVQDAFNMADKTAAYLHEIAAKEAADSDPTQPEDEKKDSPSSGESESDDSGEPSDDSGGSEGGEGGGEGPPPAEAGGPPVDLGGGGGPPPPEGGAPPEAMGGAPPEAMGGAPPEAMGGAPPDAMGGAPPEAMGGAPGGMPGEEDLLNALAGGGDMGADQALGGMMGGAPGMEGGAPPMGEPGMGAPGMGEPGMGAPGMEGGMAGGMGGPSEEDLMMLLQVLQQAGISPEEFEAAIAAKAAQAAVQRKREKEAGKKEEEWKPKTAAQAARYQETLKFVQEVMGK